MNLTSLETFLAIVETGSLVRAAERLHVSQSTVTTRLQTLEQNLGTTLVHRQKSGVELTEAGRRFRHHAIVMVELWSQATQDIALPDTVDVVCSIGCHPDLWAGPGRRLFDRVRSAHPEAALTVLPGDQTEIERLLRGSLVDLAITYDVSVHHNQTVHSLPSETLTLVSDRVGTPMRFDPKYLYVEGGEDFRRRHAAAYSDAGTARLSFGSAAWALDEVLANGGSAYLPTRLTARHLADGRLYPVADAPSFTRNVYLVLSERAGTWPWLHPIVTALTSFRPRTQPPDQAPQ